MDSVNQYATDCETYYSEIRKISPHNKDEISELKIKYNSFVEEENKLKREATSRGIHVIYDGDPSIVLAAGTGSIQIVKLLLERGVNPNIISWIEGNTPLHEACIYNLKDIVILLLEGVPPNYQGADTEIKNGKKRTVLEEALYFRRIELAKILIEHGANYEGVKTILEKLRYEQAKELEEFIVEFERRGINIKGAE